MTMQWFAKLVAVVVVAAGCSKEKPDLNQGLLVEGNGLGALEIGKSTLSKARKLLGPAAAREPNVTVYKTQLEAGPLLLWFVKAEDADEPVLQAIVAERTPYKPYYQGATRRGLRLLDTREKMLSLYGEPDYVRNGMSESVYYYEEGALFTTTYAGSISEYSGTPPPPNTIVIIRMVITRPFEVLTPPGHIQNGEWILTGPPKSTLPESVF